MDLLDVPPPVRSMENLVDSLRQTGVLLEKTLETFGIEARVMDVTRGPTITRFELEPAPGIKVSRFMSLADDLALALKSHGVRVEAPIPRQRARRHRDPKHGARSGIAARVA